MKDFYEVLGLKPTATQKEIKSAYKRLAKQYHPDKWVGEDTADIVNAEIEFKRVEEAYRVLKDSVNRAHYDTTGEANMPKSSEIASKMLISLFQKYIKQALESELAQELSSVPSTFQEFIRQGKEGKDPAQCVLINIESELKKDRKDVEATIRLLEKGVLKLNKHKRRVTVRKKNVSNLYLHVVEQQLAATSSTLAAGGIQLIAIETALLSLADYEHVEEDPEIFIKSSFIRDDIA